MNACIQAASDTHENHIYPQPAPRQYRQTIGRLGGRDALRPRAIKSDKITATYIHAYARVYGIYITREASEIAH